MKSFIKGFRNYTNFSGRTTRKDYWMFALFYLIFSFVAGFMDGLFGLAGLSGYGPIGGIFLLVMLIPALAVQIRRNHDANKSGWWVLMPFYNLYLLFVPTHPEENDWGSVPIEE